MYGRDHRPFRLPLAHLRSAGVSLVQANDLLLDLVCEVGELTVHDTASRAQGSEFKDRDWTFSAQDVLHGGA